MIIRKAMSQMVATTIVVFGTVTAGTALAETVFKHKAPDGTIEYSDVPGENATSIEVEIPTTYSFPTISPKTSTDDSTPASVARYTALQITTPSDGSAIRSNSGNLSVRGTVTPRLQPRHKVILKRNGTPVGDPQKALSFTLNNMDRGAHTLSLTIVDENGKALITSNATTVNLLRATVNKGPLNRNP